MQGFVVGADKAVEGWIMCLGVSAGMAQSAVTEQGDRGETDADTYQVTLYGTSQEVNEPYFVDGTVSLGKNEYSGQRSLHAGSIRRIAYSEYSGRQVGFTINSGYVIYDGLLKMTPTLSLDYLRLAIDAYSETNADSLNLSVRSQQYESARLGLGFALEKRFVKERMTITPGGRIAYRYDLIDDAPETTATFGGGGGAFTTVGQTPAKSSYELGASLALAMRNDITLSVDYALELQEEYVSHTGTMELRYAF
jgi:uncharacterized protein with beta-barrel porin domain